jgi:hypothetical protein
MWSSLGQWWHLWAAALVSPHLHLPHLQSQLVLVPSPLLHQLAALHSPSLLLLRRIGHT